MRTPIPGCVLAVCGFVASVPAASAQLITQWNFNSAVADSSTSTGSASPSTGSGTASAIGGVTVSFAAGSPRDAAADNTAWSLAGWPAQGTASGTAGAQFMVSTVGFTEAILISFDLRQTTTASERFQLQATSDGINFINVSGGTAAFGTVGNNVGTSFDSTGLFINTTASSAAFVQSITYSFAADSAFENNANFGFRLVSVFDGSQYDASGASANYGTSGTLRLDMVTVSAATAAVPEPSTTAVFMGACALGAVMWRRHRKRGPATRLK
jgi:hypothetical protein